jgi:hypothetical protein
MKIKDRILSMTVLVAAFCFWTIVSLPDLRCQPIDRDSIKFINSSGENALVKLVGPNRSEVSVPNGQSRTVSVAAGDYYILVRYGEPGKYRYSRGDRFRIDQEPGYYFETSITLHKIVNGNYGSRDSNQNEFNGAN